MSSNTCIAFLRSNPTGDNSRRIYIAEHNFRFSCNRGAANELQ